MRTLAIEYPETIPAMSNLSLEAFETEARLAMAMKLYELGRLTSGQAALLADIPRLAFLLNCHRFGTCSVAWDAAELTAEAEEVRQ
jgi:predicted HTH domain antitoxin